MSHPVPERVTAFARKALIVGGVALGAALVSAFVHPQEFFRSYLYAFLFWAGVPVGCLSLLCIQHLTGGRWGLLIRRLLEAGTRTLPFVGLAFLPIIFGIPKLYSWSDAALLKTDEVLRHKSLYLNTGFFVARAIFYIGVWNAVGYFLNRWSRRLDAGPDLRMDRQLRGLSGGGLVLLGLTITFSSIDWAMSLNPHWMSTIYGIFFMVAQVLSAFCLAIIALAALRRDVPFKSVMTTEVIHDLGKLLLAFVMLWTYIHLSQFLITWSANLPEEIPWYLTRMDGGWRHLAFLILFAHFVVPFLALLSRDLKRDLGRLSVVAGLVLGASVLDLFWVIAPELGRTHFSVAWTDVAALVGLGGLWLGLAARELAGRPLVPQNQPDLQAEAA